MLLAPLSGVDASLTVDEGRDVPSTRGAFRRLSEVVALEAHLQLGVDGEVQIVRGGVQRVRTVLVEVRAVKRRARRVVHCEQQRRKSHKSAAATNYLTTGDPSSAEG